MVDSNSPSACKNAQIIEAAVDEFQENGYAYASMDRISARASVSKRTLYKHFESKENLFRSIVMELAGRFAEMQDIRYVTGRDIRTQLLELAWAEGRILMRPDVMAMARMIISETLRNPALAEEAQGKVDKTATFVRMIEDASADGQLNVEDSVVAGQEFIGLIKAKAFWPMLFSGSVVSEAEMTEIVESAVDLIMSRYG
ncbi:TetR/AcrR family transcriptional regulator [uncultured Roseovarius sp.]|uniref:TetR/AcrR family transcriptional regulator n=1 Tax=uncultured Roseovarius sp. TaxID=293344 RepID=UPI00260CE2D9|nr:TetR/AcrR family transcriptional regulator [uncultured Roseovarius sp.]